MPHAKNEIEFTGTTRVIADLHLDTNDGASVAPFVRWLAEQRGLSRLVILGDLFDVWVGPAQVRTTAAPVVLDALSACAKRGIAIELVPGNRDFLLDRSFEERTAAHLHSEGFIGVANGRRISFVHGDALCTKDSGYLRLRRVLRSRAVSWIAPRVPLAVGSSIARKLRRESVRALSMKLPDEKSIQRDAVVETAREDRCDTLVCGHAHAFRDETLAGGVRFLVLGAFGGSSDVLDVHASTGEIVVSTSR